MRKVYKKLSAEQIKRGVVFSSCLSEQRFETTNDTIHEVLKNSEDKEDTIRRLRDDSFFNSSHWNFNIIRE